jgi:phage-related protein
MVKFRLHHLVKPRGEAGFLLRQLQEGYLLSMPQSRPMPSIGVRVHELRIVDEDNTWRIVYKIETDAIVIGDVFAKKTQQTPKRIVETCVARFHAYDRSKSEEK